MNIAICCGTERTKHFEWQKATRAQSCCRYCCDGCVMWIMGKSNRLRFGRFDDKWNLDAYHQCTIVRLNHLLSIFGQSKQYFCCHHEANKPHIKRLENGPAVASGLIFTDAFFIGYRLHYNYVLDVPTRLTADGGNTIGNHRSILLGPRLGPKIYGDVSAFVISYIAALPAHGIGWNEYGCDCADVLRFCPRTLFTIIKNVSPELCFHHFSLFRPKEKSVFPHFQPKPILFRITSACIVVSVVPCLNRGYELKIFPFSSHR